MEGGWNTQIVHKEDNKKKGYYLCNHAVGKGNPDKLSQLWENVTCKNCLKKHKSSITIINNTFEMRRV
jgi:hypothetical protein